MHILLLGSYSGNNKGDVAIVKSICSYIYKKDPKYKISLLSKHPEQIKSYLPFPNVKTYKSITSYWGWNTLKVIRNADLIVVGGGGIFFSKKMYNPFYNHLVNIFFISLVNRLFYKKPVYIMTAGISQLNSKLGKLFLKFILKNSDKVTVRDEYSKSLAEKLSGGLVDCYPDPAFTMKPQEGKRVRRITDKYISKDKVNVMICTNKTLARSVNLVKLQNKLSKLKKYNVVYFENIHSSSKPSHYISHKNLSPEEVIGIVSYFDIAISAPMHFSIFSYLAKTPLIMINYNSKIKYLKDLINAKYMIGRQEVNTLVKYLQKVGAIKEKPRISDSIIKSSYKGIDSLASFIEEVNKKTINR